MSVNLIRSWTYSWASQGRSARTMKEMRPFLVRFTEALDGPLATATRVDCEQFIASHASPFRANYAWRSLRSFYGWLAEEEEGPNPMAKVRAPKVPLTDVTVADKDDVHRMLITCSPMSSFGNARDAALISLLWATGLRRSEMAALRLDDVDLDSQTLVVQRSKNGRSRRVPFDDRAAQALLRYLSKREVYPATTKAPEALWIGLAGPLGSDGIRITLAKRARRANVKISAHSFRRGLAARALRGGMSQTSLMSITGWQTPVMANRYVRTVAAEVAEAEYRRVMV